MDSRQLICLMDNICPWRPHGQHLEMQCDMQVGGPETFKYREIIQLAADTWGIKEVKIRTFPLWSARLLEWFLQVRLCGCLSILTFFKKEKASGCHAHASKG